MNNQLNIIELERLKVTELEKEISRLSQENYRLQDLTMKLASLLEVEYEVVESKMNL